MESKRLLGAFAVFGILALIFSGVSGLATAATESNVFIPMPRAGDSVNYAIREVIDDEDLAQGKVTFNWARLAWRDEATLPDATGNEAFYAPLDYTLRFREGSQYQLTMERTSYYDMVRREASMDEHRYEGRATYSQDSGCLVMGACLSEEQESDTYTTARSRNGPSGLCGALTDLHGALTPPKTMEVPGYCRDFRIMESETTTTYHLRKETTWMGRDALVYESKEPTAHRLVYASGIPFPVVAEVPLAEHILEAYTVGRHFSLELRVYEPGDRDYPLHAPLELGQPLPLVARHPVLQIDDSSLPGFTLGDAYAAALDGSESPRLADFMNRPDAYVAAAWKMIVVDSDGNEIQYWTIFAADGERHLGKMVRHETPAQLAGVAMDWQGADQYSVQNVDYDPGVKFPPKGRLPDRVPSIPAAMERSTAYPHIDAPNAWGFYTHCENEGCTDVTFAVRAGKEHQPTASAQYDTQGTPPYHQHLAFFGQDGLLSHTWSWETEAGRASILPVDTSSTSIPNGDSAASRGAVWSPPGAAAAASLGFIAVLGGILYYFWPAIKVGGVGMFSRIATDDLLKHPRRRAIHELITADPGIHFQELNRQVGAGRGSLDHHVRKLEAGGLIVRQTDKGSTLFFPKGAVDHRVMKATGLLRAASTRKVLDEVVRKPGLQCADIAARTGLSNPTVSYHLGKLRKEGIIGGGRQLALTPHGQSLLSMAS